VGARPADGPVGTDLRDFGSNGNRRHVPYYVCLDHKRHGTCAKAVAFQQDIIDRALLGSIAEVLGHGPGSAPRR